MSGFGNRLRKLRIDKGLTQKQLGRLFKLSESAVGMYERGEREPSFEQTKSFAEYFGVTTDYLLGTAENMAGPVPEEIDDPEISLFFKDFKSAPKQKREEMIRFWKFIQEREKDRKPGDKQTE